MATNKIIYDGNILIDLTGDTVSTSNLLTGIKAHDRTGAIITGACSFDSNTTDATATQNEILATKTAYVNKTKLTGNMTNNGSVVGTITTKTQQYTVPQGFHDGGGKVSISSTEQAKIIPGNIKSGVEILGITGDYTGQSVSAQSKTATPTSSSQTILPDQNYDYLSQVVVNAIPYEESSNTYGTTITIG